MRIYIFRGLKCRLLTLLLLLCGGTLNLLQAQYTLDYIHILNPDSFKTNFNYYDQSTSVYCATLSELAYWTAGDYQNLLVDLQKAYPTANIGGRFISDDGTDTQLILFGTNKFVVVAFRGTAGVKDMAIDARILLQKNNRRDSLTVYKALPQGPAGFRKCVKKVLTRAQLFGHLDRFIHERNHESSAIDKFPVYLTGHSLGAALANLMALPLWDNGYNYCGLYGFAPPFSVSQSDSANVSRFSKITYDVVFHKDYIARALILWRKKLAHYGTFYRIGTDYIVRREPECFVAFTKEESKHWLDSHLLSNYIAGLRGAKNSNLEIEKRAAINDRCIDDEIIDESLCRPNPHKVRKPIHHH